MRAPGKWASDVSNRCKAALHYPAASAGALLGFQPMQRRQRRPVRSQVTFERKHQIGRRIGGMPRLARQPCWAKNRGGISVVVLPGVAFQRAITALRCYESMRVAGHPWKGGLLVCSKRSHGLSRNMVIIIIINFIIIIFWSL